MQILFELFEKKSTHIISTLIAFKKKITIHSFVYFPFTQTYFKQMS